jgi:hypothetical protein
MDYLNLSREQVEALAKEANQFAWQQRGPIRELLFDAAEAAMHLGMSEEVFLYEVVVTCAAVATSVEPDPEDDNDA